MNADSPQPPSDSELDRLLASKLHRTSPEFEQRWRELRAELSGARPGVRARGFRWLFWPGLAGAGAAAAVLAVAVLVRRPPPPAGGAPLAFEELIAFDAALQPARPLLDAENRDALLHLPAPPRD